MKLVTYLKEEHEQLGVLVNGLVHDIDRIHPDIPNTMNMFLNYWDELFPIVQAGVLSLEEGTFRSGRALPVEEVGLLAPVPLLVALPRRLCLPSACGCGKAQSQSADDPRVRSIPGFLFHQPS